MQLTDEQMIEHVLDDEGRGDAKDDPADPGGITHFGITIDGYTEFLRDKTGSRSATAVPEDIRALTIDGARDFYRWLMASTGIGRIQNADVRYFVFDSAVNMGQRPAIRLLQRALSLADDGVIGPKTLTAVPIINPTRLLVRVAFEQLDFYSRWARNDLTDHDHDGMPDRLEFQPGLIARVGKKLVEVLT